jgi:predicted secreted protein
MRRRTRSSTAEATGRVAAAVVLIVAIAAILAGCASDAGSPAPGPTLTVDCAAFESAGAGGQPLERDLAVSVGQAFRVTLCSNASTGFAWEVPTWTGDPSVELTQLGNDAPATALPGAAGTTDFTFRATAAGTTRIEFVYSQPWAGGTKGTWRLAVVVTVS